MHDEPHHHHRDHEEGEDVEVVAVGEEVELVAAPSLRREAAQQRSAWARASPSDAAGDPEELEGEAPQHLGQRQGEDAEEDAGVADAEEAEQQGHEGGGEHAAQDEELHGATT